MALNIVTGGTERVRVDSEGNIEFGSQNKTQIGLNFLMFYQVITEVIYLCKIIMYL